MKVTYVYVTLGATALVFGIVWQTGHELLPRTIENEHARKSVEVISTFV